MINMFNDCTSLTSLDVTNFKTSNVTTMGGMFSGCENLKIIYVGDNWTTSAVTSGSEMFDNCKSLNGYNLSNVDYTYANTTTGYLTYKPSSHQEWRLGWIQISRKIARTTCYFLGDIVK